MKLAVEQTKRATDLRWESSLRVEPISAPTRLTMRFWSLSSKDKWQTGAPAQMWQQYSMRGRTVALYRYKTASGGKYLFAR